MLPVRRLALGLILLSTLAFAGSYLAAGAQPSGPEATRTPLPPSYVGLTIDELTSRTYGSGSIEAVRTMTVTRDFTRTLITYPSDGLTIYGFVNTPRAPGHYPVVLVLHGYVAPSQYRTIAYTTTYADALARAGFVVIHPNYRDHPPSDSDPTENLFRVGYAIDILNLTALVRAQSGAPGLLASADPSAVALWGHSMGGGIALRVLTVSPQVRAAVLYGSMSGDERLNFERIRMWSGGATTLPELSTPDELIAKISPINFLDRVTAAVSIHHGDRDATVPPEWSVDLCKRLEALRKPKECFNYAHQPHTFSGSSDRLFIERTIAFFTAQLRATPTPDTHPPQP